MTEDQRPAPGSGPAPSPLTAEGIDGLLAAQPFGVLATNRRDGGSHLTVVVYTWDPRERVVRISTVADRLKARHLANDPRVTLLVSSDDHLSSVTIDGTAELSAVSSAPGDDAGRELLLTQRDPIPSADEAAFLEQMVTDRRLVIRLRDPRVRGTTLLG